MKKINITVYAGPTGYRNQFRWLKQFHKILPAELKYRITVRGEKSEFTNTSNTGSAPQVMVDGQFFEKATPTQIKELVIIKNNLYPTQVAC